MRSNKSTIDSQVMFIVTDTLNDRDPGSIEKRRNIGIEVQRFPNLLAQVDGVKKAYRMLTFMS